MTRVILSVLFFVFSSYSFADEGFSKESLYQLKTEWKNQNDKVVQLKDYSQKPVIISMVYTSCPHSCPMTISKIQDIENDLKKLNVTNYKIVLASFDTKKDNPKNLKKYMKKRKLDESRWEFLSQSKDSHVRELATILGINYKDLGDGDFSHSNVLTVLDKDGKIVSRIESLSADHKDLVEKIKKINE